MCVVDPGTATLLAAGIGAGTSLGSSLLGSNSSGLTWSDVEKQEALAGAQWRENRALYALQRGDYLSDLEDERKYNSASEQVRRLREAGLNPALVFGEGNVGSSSSAPSYGAPTSPASPSAYDRAAVHQAYASQIANTIGASVDSYLNAQIKKNEIIRTGALARQEDVKAYVAEQSKISELERVLRQNKKDSVEYKFAKAQLQFYQNTFDDRVRQQNYLTVNLNKQADVMDSQIAELNSRSQLENLQAKLAPLQLKIDSQKAQAAFISANAAATSAAASMKQADTSDRLANANIDKIAADAANSWIQAAGSAIDYKHKEKVKDLIFDLYKSDLLNAKNKSEAHQGLLPLDLIKDYMPNLFVGKTFK